MEAEGCFFVYKKNFLFDFILPQSSKDLALMKAIQDYFNNLGRGQFDDVVRYRERSQPTSMISLHIHRIDYITKVLIPFFDNLT